MIQFPVSESLATRRCNGRWSINPRIRKLGYGLSSVYSRITSPVFKMNFTSSNDISLLNIWEIIWSLNRILLQVTVEPLYKDSEIFIWHQHNGLVSINQNTLLAISFGQIMMKLVLHMIQLTLSILKPKRQESTCLFKFYYINSYIYLFEFIYLFDC